MRTLPRETGAALVLSAFLWYAAFTERAWWVRLRLWAKDTETTHPAQTPAPSPDLGHPQHVPRVPRVPRGRQPLPPPGPTIERLGRQ